VASWAVLRLKHDGRQCWGVSEKSGRVPRTRKRERAVNTFRRCNEAEGDWDSPTSSTNSQRLWIHLHVPSRPFYRETKGLLHSENTLELKNIPNVNTYKNVFFISYFYKPATSSHSKLGLFGTTTLTLLLTSSWTSPFATFELDFRQIPELAILRSSWLRRFEIPEFRMFPTLRLRRFKIPENRMFATLRLHRSKIPENLMSATPRLRRSQIAENRKFLSPEKHISRTSLNSMFRGWRVFLNSPTLNPMDA
jgi:hypothetical protein